MLQAYWPIVVLIALTTGLGVLMVILGHLIGPRRKSDRKSAPYESGMKPIGSGTRQLPVRFYIVAVLFILFDIEVVFLLPWAVVFREFLSQGLGGFAILEIIIFLAILLVGYIYAWKKGALDWE